MLDAQEGRVEILGPMAEGRGCRHQCDRVKVAADIRATLAPVRTATCRIDTQRYPTGALRHLASYVQHQEGGQDGGNKEASPTQSIKAHSEKQGGQQIAKGIARLQEP